MSSCKETCPVFPTLDFSAALSSTKETTCTRRHYNTFTASEIQRSPQQDIFHCRRTINSLPRRRRAGRTRFGSCQLRGRRSAANTSSSSEESLNRQTQISVVGAEGLTPSPADVCIPVSVCSTRRIIEWNVRVPVNTHQNHQNIPTVL